MERSSVMVVQFLINIDKLSRTLEKAFTTCIITPSVIAPVSTLGPRAMSGTMIMLCEKKYFQTSKYP